MAGPSVDIEKLVELVRERQFLYDLSHRDYKNRPKIKGAWIEIGTEMGVEDGVFWSSNWKALKDNYAKHKKSIAVSSGQAYKKYKNWPWAELLRFLDDFNKNRQTETNVNSDSQTNTTEDNPNSRRQEASSTEADENFSRNESQNSETTLAENPRSVVRKRRAKNNDEQTNTVLDYLRKKNEQKIKFDEADHFFLSYAQSFKKFPKRTQSIIKLEIATLFARYELENESESSSGTQMAPPSVASRTDFVGAFQSSPSLQASSESDGIPSQVLLPNTTFQTSAPQTLSDSTSQNATEFYEAMARSLTDL